MAPFVIGKCLGSRTRTRCFQRAFLPPLVCLPFLPVSPPLPLLSPFLTNFPVRRRSGFFCLGAERRIPRQMEAESPRIFISMRYLRTRRFPRVSNFGELTRPEQRVDPLRSLVRRVLRRNDWPLVAGRSNQFAASYHSFQRFGSDFSSLFTPSLPPGRAIFPSAVFTL